MGFKIGIFTSEFTPYPGGIATYTFELAAAARELGHEPIVYAPKMSTHAEINASFRVVRNQPMEYNHFKVLAMMVRDALTLRRTKPDIIIAADLPNILALSSISWPGRKVAVVHGTDVKSRIVGYLNSYTFYRPFNAFDAIYSNSLFTKNLMLRHNPSVPPNKIYVAPLGVSKFWREEVSQDELKPLVRRFALLPERFLMLSVGRIEPRKGVAQAIKAISKLPADLRKGITYLIVGRSIEMEYAQKLAEMIATSDMDIRMVGEVTREELRALYHTANLLLHTATADRFRAEGFGLVLAEAAACGLPALATKIDAIPEVVQENVSGVLIDDGDLDAIGRSIVKFMCNPSLLHDLAISAKNHSWNFTWKICAETIIGNESSESVKYPFSSKAP